MSYQCKGIVIDDNGVCHIMKDNVPLEHPGTSGTYIQGRTAFYRSNPPPPPHYPQSASCIGFTEHRFEDIPTGEGAYIHPCSTPYRFH